MIMESAQPESQMGLGSAAGPVDLLSAVMNGQDGGFAQLRAVNVDSFGVQAEAAEEDILGNEEDGIRVVRTLAAPPGPLGPDDHRRMLLTNQELEWALDIKDAIEMTPEIDNLPDFWYAQLAIIVKDDVASAVCRARQLQDFRQEYRVRDEYEEGRHAIRTFIKSNPRFTLAFSFNHQTGVYVLVNDIAQFDLESLTASPESIERFLLEQFYEHNSLYPDLEAVRRGHTVLCECEGFSFRNKMNFTFWKQLFVELLNVYPLKSKVLQYNTSVFYNMLMAMLVKVMPKEVGDSFKAGCKFDGGRLDTVYLVPTVEEANEKLIARLQESLQRRYKNIASFSLNDFLLDMEE